ncbi:MAG: hypothetical protein HRT40_01795 [Campylobacteraceae bacterium]|nr:hypothetical protein [Campylobacteraceae bacterium]
MANNLFISYDLNSTHKNYDGVINEIKNLGDWASIQKSMWYLNSNLTAQEVATKIHSHMESNDTLIVIDTFNNDAYWYNLSDEVGSHIQNHWNK